MSESTRAVKVKNQSRGYVTLKLEKFRRTFPFKATAPVPFDELKYGLYDPAIDSLFKAGILAIVDKQDAIDLELVEDIPEPEAVDVEAMAATLLSGNQGKIVLLLKKVKPQAHKAVFDFLVTNKISDNNIAKTVRECFGQDYDLVKSVAAVMQLTNGTEGVKGE